MRGMATYTHTHIDKASTLRQTGRQRDGQMVWSSGIGAVLSWLHASEAQYLGIINPFNILYLNRSL